MSTLQERYNHLIMPVIKKTGIWGAEKQEDRSNLVSDIVNAILEQAIIERASDIHCEPVKNALRVRYRIDGLLNIVLLVEEPAASLLIRRLKVMAGMQNDGIAGQVAQDARFKQRFGATEYDFRVATFPLVNGEKIVLRVLNNAAGTYDLAKVGLDETDQIKLRRVLQLKNGLFLVCGPTGSGKTSTLYSLMKEKDSPAINIVTLEDPVEYQIDGLNQCDIKARSRFSFADGLKAVLRQDPDIVLVGEIRDNETADIATRASITGHLVFSSVHANSAIGTIVRLLNMGVEPYIVSYSLMGVISQRLVRQVCPHCRVRYQPTDAQLKVCRRVAPSFGGRPAIRSAGGIEYGDPADGGPEPASFSFYKGTGCPECRMSGYLGRIGIFEVLIVDELLRDGILKGSSSGELRALAARSGNQTLQIDALKKMTKGLTTFDEVYPFLIEEA